MVAGSSPVALASLNVYLSPGCNAPVKLIVTLQRDETGMVVAECPAIPGCVSQGSTEDEALANVQEAIRGCLEARAAHGMPLTVAVREVDVALS